MWTRTQVIARPLPLPHSRWPRRARAALRQRHLHHEGRPGTPAHGFLALAPVAWLKAFWSRLDANRWLGLGSEMAFWLFLSLLPLAAVAGLAAAKLSIRNEAVTAGLLASLPAAAQELIGHELGRMAAWNGGQVGIGAGIMFVWLASSGVHSVFDGLEIESDAQPRPWWKKRLLAIAACAALSVGIAVLAFLGSGASALWHLFGGDALFKAAVLESSLIGRILRGILGLGIAFGLVSGLYWVALPPRTRERMPILPGTVLAIALQIVIGFGYRFYIDKTGDGSAYQAGLASIGITLMALYLFCLALLAGVELNQQIGEHRPAPVIHV